MAVGSSFHLISISEPDQFRAVCSPCYACAAWSLYNICRDGWTPNDLCAKRLRKRAQRTLVLYYSLVDKISSLETVVATDAGTWVCVHWGRFWRLAECDCRGDDLNSRSRRRLKETGRPGNEVIHVDLRLWCKKGIPLANGDTDTLVDKTAQETEGINGAQFAGV